MDKSKMAKQGTVINYDDRKGGHHYDGMSRPIETPCGEWCCCDKCCKDGKKSLDDTLNPPEVDKNDLCCC
jgi:hypothetical protein